MGNTDFIGLLPAEIAIAILTQLHSHADVLAASLVSRCWSTRARDVEVWHTLFLRRARSDGWTLMPGAEMLWRRMVPRMQRQHGGHSHDDGEEDEEEDEDEEGEFEEVRLDREPRGSGYRTQYVREKDAPMLVTRRMTPAFVDGPLGGGDESVQGGEDAGDLTMSSIASSSSTVMMDTSVVLQAAPTPPDLTTYDWYTLYRARHMLSRRWRLASSSSPRAKTSTTMFRRKGDAPLSSVDIPGASPPPLDSDPETASSDERRGSGGLTRGESRRRRRRRKAAADADDFQPRTGYLEGHQDSIYCVRFDTTPFYFPVDSLSSSDPMAAPLYDAKLTLGLGSRGKIVSGSRDKTIKIWDGDTGICLSTLHGHKGSVLCLAYDDEHLVSGSSDQNVIVWDLGRGLRRGETPVAIKTLTGHSLGVLDLDLNDEWLISSSKDTTVRIWRRSNDWALEGVYRKHEGPVNAGCMMVRRDVAADGTSRERTVVASASGEGSVHLWDIATRETLRTFEGHERGLACVRLASDIVVTGSNDTTVRIWDAVSAKCLAICSGHHNLVRALAFDEKRMLVASGGYDYSVKLFSIRDVVGEARQASDDGDERNQTKQEQTTAVAHKTRVLTPLMDLQSHRSRVFDVQLDGTRIVSCGEDERICVLDFAGQDRIMRLFD